VLEVCKYCICERSVTDGEFVENEAVKRLERQTVGRGVRVTSGRRSGLLFQSEVAERSRRCQKSVEQGARHVISWNISNIQVLCGLPIAMKL
jgi:hypothetical protein